MPATPSRSPWITASLLGVRFLYLLWGGMLMCTFALHERLAYPAFLWRWPEVVLFLGQPLGRGLMLGLGVAMALAALVEIWELVDFLLLRLMHDHERDH